VSVCMCVLEAINRPSKTYPFTFIQIIFTTLHYTRALFSACYNGHTECARLLIDFEADVNAKNVGGATSLYAAVQRGHLRCVELLVAVRWCIVWLCGTHAGTYARECSMQCVCFSCSVCVILIIKKLSSHSLTHIRTGLM
jgi:hypothetical protein